MQASTMAALEARGYRRYSAPQITHATALWQRRVGAIEGRRQYIDVWEYAPLRPGDGTRFEVEATFDRGADDGTWARVLIYGFEESRLLDRLDATERAIEKARAALLEERT